MPEARGILCGAPGRLGAVAALALGAAACSPFDDGAPVCSENYSDVDCDGVPDERDLCPATPEGELHDAAGCSAAQAATCVASPRWPEKGQVVELDSRDLEFRWDGTCDGYLVYLSPDPEFAPADTVVVGRSTSPRLVLTYSRWKEVLGERDVELLYWQVRGGREGREYVSESRSVVLKRGRGT